MARIKSSYKLKPLYMLNDNCTKICDTMISYIPDAYTFKIYVYLCYRYNNEFQYAFPSLNTISKDTHISKRKVQDCIKWLEKKKFIVRYKRKDGEWMNNCYYVRYVEENKQEEEKKIVDAIDKGIEVNVIVDEEGNEFEVINGKGVSNKWE